ncbi:hypothetical protein vseg_012699 [Gypsophila vaccaria]
MAKVAITTLFILVFLASPFFSRARPLGTNSESVYVVPPTSGSAGGTRQISGKVFDDCLPKSRLRRDSAPSRYTNEESLGATLCSNVRVEAPFTP